MLETRLISSKRDKDTKYPPFPSKNNKQPENIETRPLDVRKLIWKLPWIQYFDLDENIYEKNIKVASYGKIPITEHSLLYIMLSNFLVTYYSSKRVKENTLIIYKISIRSTIHTKNK